ERRGGRRGSGPGGGGGGRRRQGEEAARSRSPPPLGIRGTREHGPPAGARDDDLQPGERLVAVHYALRRDGATGGTVDALRRRSGRIPPLWVYLHRHLGYLTCKCPEPCPLVGCDSILWLSDVGEVVGRRTKTSLHRRRTRVSPRAGQRGRECSAWTVRQRIGRGRTRIRRSRVDPCRPRHR